LYVNYLSNITLFLKLLTEDGRCKGQVFYAPFFTTTTTTTVAAAAAAAASATL